MSTDTQLKGDSLRRQKQLSENYAIENGLELVQEDDLFDIGISAFKGENAVSGALGRFLEASRAGRIPKGSYLLVESLDRLSRQSSQAAITQFLEIVRLWQIGNDYLPYTYFQVSWLRAGTISTLPSPTTHSLELKLLSDSYFLRLSSTTFLPFRIH